MSQKTEDRVEESEDKEVCFKIMPSGSKREAVLMILQQYGFLNKTQTITIQTDLSR